MARRIELTTLRYLRNLIHVSVLGAAGALVAVPAAGNGRFPTAQHLVEHPRDPQKLMLRTTFGLLLSKDAGKSWRWVCEQAVGFRDNEDPPVDITGSGALLVGVFGGLSVSRDFGCEWTTPPEIQGKNVKDVSVQADDPSKAVLVTSNGSANLIFTNQVYKTVDDGVTWTKLGPDLPTDLVTHTLDVAPSNPSRVYVTASLYSPDGGADTGRLLQLSAAGDAWEAVTIPGMGEPYLSGIDPTDDKLVYVRMNGLDSDQLVVTRDAGVSWTKAMSVGGTPGMLGFALSPDGSTVLVGDDPTGIYRAPSSSLVFEPVSDFRNQCLTWTPTALYACSSYFLNGEFVEKGFLLARSDDVGNRSRRSGTGCPTCSVPWSAAPRPRPRSAAPLAGRTCSATRSATARPAMRAVDRTADPSPRRTAAARKTADAASWAPAERRSWRSSHRSRFWHAPGGVPRSDGRSKTRRAGDRAAEKPALRSRRTLRRRLRPETPDASQA